jgi:hypothetical protein
VGHNEKAGRRVKPCACGLPAEQRREALAAQKKSQYESVIAELLRTSWPVSALLRVVARGNSDTIYMATGYLDIMYGDRWLVNDKRIPNPRLWAQLRDDLIAAMGGEEENTRREAHYAKLLALACHKLAHALGIDERYATARATRGQRRNARAGRTMIRAATTSSCMVSCMRISHASSARR